MTKICLWGKGLMHGQQLIGMPKLSTINDNKLAFSVAAAAASSTAAVRLLFLTARGISLQQ